MIIAFLIIFSFLGLGEGINYFFDLPIAGNILGMLLIIFALQLKIIKLEWVKPASDKLLQFLVLFFIPYGVGLMAYFDLIASYWWPITLSVVMSTGLTLLSTGWVLQKFKASRNEH